MPLSSPTDKPDLLRQSFHRFVDILLPLAIPKTYTYALPEEMFKRAQKGVRVEVQLGKRKQYAGLIFNIHSNPPKAHKPKPILSVIDEKPLVSEVQFAFWQWMAEYYACTLGEIMIAALPARFKLASETRLTLGPAFSDDMAGLSDREATVAKSLQHNPSMSIKDISELLGIKSVYPIVQKLLDKKAVYLHQEIKDKYKPKTIKCIRLQQPYTLDGDKLNEAFDLVQNAARQTEALMAFIQLSHRREFVRTADIYKLAKVDISVLKAMQKKGVIEIYERNISRLSTYEEEPQQAPSLSDQQKRALKETLAAFESGKPVLLHGVTGSGKTRVYVELIQQALSRGEQVLYLLPEIALTAQLVQRLQHVFGGDVAVYHSRLNDNERVELWKAVQQGKPIVMGARSGTFLPFSKLGLIIIDEEHDSSFKQFDPAPRYNARDAAVYLGRLSGANVIMGTATPAMETYQNALSGKYALVEMKQRFGGLELPEMIVVDKRKEMKDRKIQSHFTSTLIEEIKQNLENDKQVILFQNRRGYAPSIHCHTCGWCYECVNCDVTLTYHQHKKQMRCHYCSYHTPVPVDCPACGRTPLSLHGYGTEKVEDELKIYFPDVVIDRMDHDTASGKHAHSRIIGEFSEGRTDILVGTQMVTKGLDFDNVGLVGVLSADHLLQFPDFRASERAYQLITQVAGRAGRKNKRGKVIIQAFNTEHPVLEEAMSGDFEKFFNRELSERSAFSYPPFIRLINVTLKHVSPEVLDRGMKQYYDLLPKSLAPYIIGPSLPVIARIRNQYMLHLMLKLPSRPKALAYTKNALMKAAHRLHAVKGLSGVRVNIDVDPS